MQTTAAVVILATFVVLASARSHFLEKRRSSQEQCGEDLMECMQHVMALDAEMQKAGGDIGDFVQSATIRQHCSLINPITSCVKSAVRGSCSGVFAEDERKMIMNAVDLADYVCVDNLNAFEANEQCFQEVAEQDDDLKADCEPKLEQCDVSGLNRCIATAMSRAPSCNAESQRLFNGLMAKMIKLAPGCKARKQLQRVVELIVMK